LWKLRPEGLSYRCGSLTMIDSGPIEGGLFVGGRGGGCAGGGGGGELEDEHLAIGMEGAAGGGLGFLHGIFG